MSLFTYTLLMSQQLHKLLILFNQSLYSPEEVCVALHKSFPQIEVYTVSKYENLCAELSKTEQIIARMCYEGFTAKEIAKEKKSSVHTINKHINNIYKKMGVTTKVQLINRMRGMKAYE